MAKPARPFSPMVATANDLRSGAVVFLTEAGAWTTALADARVAETPDAAEALLALAQADDAANRVVEPVLVEVRRSGATIGPAGLRESIRATGPTVGPSAAAPA